MALASGCSDRTASAARMPQALIVGAAQIKFIRLCLRLPSIRGRLLRADAQHRPWHIDAIGGPRPPGHICQVIARLDSITARQAVEVASVPTSIVYDNDRCRSRHRGHDQILFPDVHQ